MTGAIFSGIWVPLVTPFRDGEVDYKAVKGLAGHLIDGGIHGLVVGGTTGEGASLTLHEKIGLVDAVLEAAGGRCPVIVGLEGASTARLSDEARTLAQWPVEGYLLSAPSYIRPMQEGIFRHFVTIAEAADRPVVIYDIPARTGIEMTFDTIVRLIETGLFPAIKVCELTTNYAEMLLTFPGLHVLAGDDAWLYNLLDIGGHGAIMASAHIAPQRFVEIYDLMQRGARETAWKRFHVLRPLIRQMFADPNPAPVKAALALQGWIENELRLPMTPIGAQSQGDLTEILRGLNALDHDFMSCADKSLK